MVDFEKHHKRTHHNIEYIEHSLHLKLAHSNISQISQIIFSQVGWITFVYPLLCARCLIFLPCAARRPFAVRKFRLELAPQAAEDDEK